MSSGRFLNNIAYITGAASGIGFATAKEFALEGAHVVAVDTDRDGLERLSEVEGLHPITTAQVDITDRQQIVESLKLAKHLGSPISILVNCAAVFDMQPLAQASEADVERSQKVNVKGTRQVTELVAATMIEASVVNGSIVNVSSLSGMGDKANETVYSKTKEAILNMTAKMAVNFGKSGIRVNSVSPGPILTPASYKHADQIGVDIATFKNGAKTSTIIGRMGKPEEVARAILFLASSESSYITGANLVVDGGFSLK